MHTRADQIFISILISPAAKQCAASLGGCVASAASAPSQWARGLECSAAPDSGNCVHRQPAVGAEQWLPNQTHTALGVLAEWLLASYLMLLE